jgi:VWFA-related protein
MLFQISFRKGRLTLVLNLLLSSILLHATLPVYSQNKKEPQKRDDADDVIKVSSNLVNVDVMVKDKKGKPITDLKEGDFILSENGVRQNIAFFDSTLVADNAPKPSGSVSVSTSPRSPNNLPRNIISLVFDAQTTEGSNLKHVRDGMTRYIRDRISDSDSVALFVISGGLQMLQSFTHDKPKLISAVEKAEHINALSTSSEQRSLNDAITALRDQLATPPSPDAVDTPAGGSSAAQAMIARRVLEQYVQMRSVLSAQQTRPILAALAAICEGQRAIPGKKTVVVFSQGFIAPQALDWQVQSTIDIANRSNVSIYIIDSAGLTGGTPQSGSLVPGGALAGISSAVGQEQRIRAGAGESVFDVSRQEGLNRQQDLLYRISGDTGGQFIKNTNDIAAGLDRIDEEIRSRYTLAYRSTDPNFDGSFRKVKIEVRRPDAKVMTRPGYYAIPPGQIVPLSPEDKKLLANLETPSGNAALPLSLQLTSFRSQPGSYVVPLTFEIPPAAVTFEKKGDKQRLQLDVLGLVRVEGDTKILSRLGGAFDVDLTANQYESILNDKIFYRQDIQLESGIYTIDLVVRDRVSGRVAARRQSLTLPGTDSEFSTTDPVLSRHAEPVRQPLAVSVDVLRAGNVLIRPSPSREFLNTDNLIIFFNLYNAMPAAETGKPLVRVTVTLVKDGKPAIRPLDYELTETVPEPAPHLAFAKYVKLAGLPPGKYSALIETRDMVGKKVVKQEASFAITP